MFHGSFAVRLGTCVPCPAGTYPLTVLNVQPADVIAAATFASLGVELLFPSAMNATTAISATIPAPEAA